MIQSCECGRAPRPNPQRDRWSPRRAFNIIPGRSSGFFGWLTNHGQFDYRLFGKVLEIGVGQRRLSPTSHTVDGDPASGADTICDIRRMPFRDKEFDLAVAHEVFCTHDSQAQAEMLAEIVRVSRAQYLRQWRFCGWQQCGFKFDHRMEPAEISRFVYRPRRVFLRGAPS